MCKHRGGFPEGQSPIVLDILIAMLNITSNIYIKKTVYNITKYKIKYILK